MPQQSIENHGIIGNMRTTALVALDGAIDFFCYPEFDSPTVFAALLDEKNGGFWRIDPQLPGSRVKQIYLPDTNILLTRFLSTDGVAEITDFMPILKNPGTASTLVGPEHGAHQVLRMVRVVKGEVCFSMRCSPRFDYARSRHKAICEGDSVCFEPEGETQPGMALHATVALRTDGQDAFCDFLLKSGETAMFAFGQVKRGEQGHGIALDPSAIEQRFEHTASFWRDWVTRSNYKGRWREIVDRSALLLKLLSSQQHGSLIAAPTFGLPELPGGGRNWDYRYTWLRDASFTLYAFMRLGFVEEVRDFTRWLRERLQVDAENGPLQVMYGVDGRKQLEERELGNLGGFRDSRPVRIGNAAYNQLQLDIYGEMMDAAYLANKYGDAISYEGWHSIQSVLAWLEQNWERPDEGIWEVRGGRRHFLHSRLMCWVAFDRAVRLAEKRSLAGPVEKWRRTRDTIYEDIFKNFWSEKRQSFVQSKGSEDLDAAVLLMPLMRFISPVDARWLSTMRAVEQNLIEDSLVYRYDTANGDVDGLEGKEGSFNACSFWYVECLARSHQTQKARLLFEKMLAYANHLGLYSEQLGSDGSHLGNFPQALTHLALISTATYLDRALSGANPGTWR